MIGNQNTTISQPIASHSLRSLTDGLTVELGGYVLIFIGAVASRLGSLDSLPLSGPEALQALESYRFIHTGIETSTISPFLFTANSILFFLFGANDLVARVIPAIFGIALVLAPFLLRRELRRLGALIVSLLFLVSPSLIFFSRKLDGEIVALTAGLIAAIFLLRSLDNYKPAHLYSAATFGAIAITSGAGVYTPLLAALIIYVFRKRLGTATVFGDAESQPHADRPAEYSHHLRNSLIVFIVGSVVYSTTFLLNRRGFGDALNLFGSWLDMIKPFGSVTSPLYQLLVYEPLVLVFGIAGLAYTLNKSWLNKGDRRIQLFSTGWFLIAAFLYSISEKKPSGQVLGLVVPLTLLGGWFIGELVERAIHYIEADGGLVSMASKELPVGALVAIFTSFIYLQVAMWLSNGRLLPSRDPVTSGASDSLLLLVLLFLSVLVIGLFTFATMGALRGSYFAAIAVAVLAAVATMRGAWLLNFSGVDSANEPLATTQSTFQISDMIRELVFVSEWRANDPHALTIQVQQDLTPVLQWYLRLFPNTQYTNKPTASPNLNAAITDTSTMRLSRNWISQTYRIESTWQPGNLNTLDLWRWIVFRQGGTRTWDSVKLWLPGPQ